MSQASLEYLGIGEAAKELGVSADTIRRWYDAGELAGYTTPGGQRRITRSSIDALRSDPSAAVEAGAS